MKKGKHIWINGVESKKCYHCNEYLSLDKFHIDNRSFDKLQNRCKQCRKDYSNKSVNRNLISRKSRYKIKYNLTLEEYENLKLLQNNKCAICDCYQNDNKSQHLHVDHCHKTGRIS